MAGETELAELGIEVVGVGLYTGGGAGNSLRPLPATDCIISRMLVLSLDTTSRAGSCALVRDAHVVCEQGGDASREQAERLPGELAVLLERQSVALSEVDCLAVATGPGSFTGLRVGIATMQGLAMAAGKPLIGVSAFDALGRLSGVTNRERPGVPAAQVRAPAGSSYVPGATRVAAWIDAWRGEVFAAMYEDGCDVEAPVVAHPEDLLVRLKGRATVFIGAGAARNEDLIRAVLGETAWLADPVSPLLAGAIATLAGEAFRTGQRPRPHAIRPIYVRRADTEPVRSAGRV